MSLHFRDDRRTCVVVATGPSAGAADLEPVRGRASIVVNDAWRLAPWADVLYACDRGWWDFHHAAVRQGFNGQRWTQDAHAARAYALHRIEGRHASGLSRKPGLIFYNSNSGAQAINLAYLWGARRIVLVGFDMGPIAGEAHFFGEHPPALRKASPFEKFIANMHKLALDLRLAGVELVNTSPSGRLPFIAYATLADAL